jgi:hypothetical protein
MHPRRDSLPARQSQRWQITGGIIIFLAGDFFISAHYLFPGWDAIFARYTHLIATITNTLNLNALSVGFGLFLLFFGLLIVASIFATQHREVMAALALVEAAADDGFIPQRAYV